MQIIFSPVSYTHLETVVATHARRQKELEQQLEKAMNLHHSLTVQAESYKGQTTQLEKELVRLTAVLQQDELKINEWLTLQKETYAELEQLFSVVSGFRGAC